jgi:menaquinone-dependent protoporphyrinogen oxidase
MNILVIYGTTEGQTRKIAGFVTDHLRGKGVTVALIDSTEVPKGFSIDGFDAVIAAGSVHNGRHQASLFQFVRKHLTALQDRPTALLSVSLSMASDDKEDRLDAVTCAERFIEATEWKPTVTHLVAGALRYTQYDFFKGWMLKVIAGAKGASTDTSKDHEFTDWNDLKAFADAFLLQVGKFGDQSSSATEKRAFTGQPSELFAEKKAASER